MRLRPLAVLLLVLPAFPVSAAPAGPAPLEVTGPDADGAFLLSWSVARESEGPVPLALHVRREDGAGVVESRRDLGARALPAGATRVDLSFLPSEGPGDYEVALAADGALGGPLRFAVESSGGSASFTFDVADESTTLALTNDSVNADGKLKTPGEVVLTRALLRDGNGVGDVDEVRWRVERGGVPVEEGVVPVAAPGDATEASVEVRFSRAPLAAGPHVVRLIASKDGAAVAEASRTFVSREVATLLVGGNLTPALAGRASHLSTAALLADRNGEPPADAQGEWRVWRSSFRVEDQGFRVEAPPHAQATRLPDQDGHGRASLPVRVHVPANATPGLHRASFYLDGALVGSLPFEVRRAPDLAEVRAEPAPGGGLRLVARGNGTGHLVARTQGLPERAEGAFEAGLGEVTLPPGAGRWELGLFAFPGDETPLAAREGDWPASSAGPVLRLAERHVRARLPASWTVEAEGWDLAHAEADVTVLRWDGAPAPNVTARLDGALLRVHGPPDLVAGRYDARLVLAWPNGTRGEASWSFEAGAWASVTLGEPQVSGREARIPLRNDGGAPLRRLVAEVQPDVAGAGLLVDGHLHEAHPGVGGRRAFHSFELAPGARAELVLRLPDGPLPSGARPASVRVLALAGGA